MLTTWDIAISFDFDVTIVALSPDEDKSGVGFLDEVLAAPDG
jgi:hypothetical protein